MNPLLEKFNKNVYGIDVSLIRQFDEQVSSISNMIKLTLGEPDFNTPTHIKNEGKKAIEDNFSHYSQMAGLPSLREAASYFMKEKYGVSYDANSEILVTVGATEALSASLLSILNPGDRVLMPTPIYPGYEPLVHLAGGIPTYLDTSDSDFILTPEKIEEAMEQYGDEVKAIILNYPSNPTGVTYNREEVERIATVLKKYSIFIISDEIYSELTYEGNHVSIAKYLPEQTILINGLSKSHAMTGWRIGFLFGPKEFISEIVKVHQYLVTAASTISQKASVSALIEGINDASIMKKEYQKRRDFVYQQMFDLGFEIARPNGAFYIFAKIPDGYLQNSMEFCVDLAQKNKLAIIPGVAFGESGEGYVRVSYAASLETLTEAMERLKTYMQK